MISTTQFFIWFFRGLGGIGGWLIFFLLSAAAVLYVLVDSLNRKLPALGWRLGVILLTLLILPALVYRFVTAEVQATLNQYLEILFYLGIIGGIVPIFVALGYFLRFRGQLVCPNGHVYDAILGECPECLPPQFGEGLDFEPPTGEPLTGAMQRDFIETEFGRVGLPIKTKPKAQAFLLLADGHSYQLNTGTNTLGRDSKNDFVFDNEFVSRFHSKIIEEQPGLFRLHDLGSKNGTWLNGRKLLKPSLLESDDEVRVGDEVKFTFLAKSRNK